MKCQTMMWVACAGLLGASGCDVRPVDGEGGSEIPSEVQAAFDNACATPGCHSGASPAGSLSLSAGSSDAILSATSSTGVPLVQIGDLYNSYLALKLLPPSAIPADAPNVSGAQMPEGPARPEEVAVIISWIAGLDVEGLGGDGATPCLGPESLPANLNFEEHVFPIIEGGCILANCHADGDNALILPDGDPMGTYDMLVDAPAARLEAANMMDPMVTVLDYIEPGAPDQSYLWLKVTNTHREVLGGGGLPMPPGGELCPSDMRAMYKWIYQGAAP